PRSPVPAFAGSSQFAALRVCWFAGSGFAVRGFARPRAIACLRLRAFIAGAAADAFSSSRFTEVSLCHSSREPLRRERTELAAIRPPSRQRALSAHAVCQSSIRRVRRFAGSSLAPWLTRYLPQVFN